MVNLAWRGVRSAVGVILLGAATLSCSGSAHAPYNPNAPVAGPEHGAYLADALAERNRLVVECLAEHGIAATATDDGGIEIPTLPGQDATPIFELQEGCRDDLVAAGRISPPSEPTREYFEGSYAYNLSLKTCLEAEGFEISEPPSVETYIDSYLNFTGEGSWAPYNDISPGMLSQAEWEDLNRICPQSYRVD